MNKLHKVISLGLHVTTSSPYTVFGISIPCPVTLSLPLLLHATLVPILPTSYPKIRQWVVRFSLLKNLAEKDIRLCVCKESRARYLFCVVHQSTIIVIVQMTYS